MRNFPNFIKAYLEYCGGHESTPRVQQWSIISVMAAALERRVWMPRGFYTLYPNLYVFIIGRSGLIKKSTSTGMAVNLFRELDGARMMSERLTAASLVEQLALAGKQFELDGQRYKQSSLFAYASELSVFLSEVFGSITELLTTFYDCQPNDANKPWIHRTKGGGETKIFGPCLNILGASTKTWLTKCIPKTEMEGGFTSRIIFVVENNIPDKLVAWPELDVNAESIRIRLIQDLKEIYMLKGAVRVVPKARQLFTNWYEHHMREVMPMNQDPRMVGYMARKGDTILKLAMIQSVARGNSLTIEPQDIIWAGDEMDALEADWRLAFDSLSQSNGLGFELLNYIRTKGKVRKEELLKTFLNQYPPTEIGREIQILMDMGEICEEKGTTFGDRTGYYTFKGAELKLLDTVDK